ncbi:18835_t:CDS:2, partial [Gigaspora margarita]
TWKSEYLKESENKSYSLEKSFRKRTLLCSQAGFAESKECNSNDEIPKKERNRVSQRCGCPFYIRVSLNNLNSLWQIINMDLTHNHLMVKEIIDFLSGVDVPTICAILKEEFGDHVTWMYDDIYNFIYHLEGSGLEKRELDAEEFVKILDQFKYADAEFFYYVDINEDTKRLERAIWIFPKQRINYSRFNDIVVYDNTYKTNHFKMAFGIFTGIFTKFLKMVNQHAPAVILTDDDHAMANAYSK